MKTHFEYNPTPAIPELHRRPLTPEKGYQRSRRTTGNSDALATNLAQGLVPPPRVEELPLQKATLQQLFDRWKAERWVELGKSNQVSLNAAYKHCIALADWQYQDIKAPQMQWCIDHSNRSYAMQSTIKSLWGHLDRFAQDIGVLPKVASEALVVPPAPSSDRPIFSQSEIALLWKKQNMPWVDTVLFQLYSGARINEMFAIKVAHVDLKQKTLQLGEPSAPDEYRLVPIHPKIIPIVERWLELSSGNLLLEYRGKVVSPSKYRLVWREVMETLGLDHTPNHCRNTFQKQLEEVNIRPAIQKALMDFESSYIPTGEYSREQKRDLEKAMESIY